MAKLDVAREELILYSPEYLNKLKELVAQAEKSHAQSATSLLIYLEARRTYSTRSPTTTRRSPTSPAAARDWNQLSACHWN